MHFALAMSVIALAILAIAAPQPQNAGVSIPVAKHSRLVNADKSVRIEALNAHAATIKAKILRGLNNFERNTGDPGSDTVEERILSRGTSAEVTDSDDELWYGTISVGTPSNSFTVQLDTGSSDLFLPGPECKENCAGHNIYDPGASSTAHDLNRTSRLTYGDGSTVLGELYSDTCGISGLAAQNQVLCVGYNYDSSLAPDHFATDGLLGMAFQPVSAFNATPLFQNLVAQGRVDEPVFSFKLATTGSELYLGGANPALYVGDFTYAPVTKEAYWEVKMNVESEGRTVLSNIDAVIDTGTTFVTGEPPDVKTLYGVLGGTDASRTVGDGFYTFPCDSFPPISLTFGGTSFPMSNETLNLGPVSPGSSDCVSSLVALETNRSIWIVGDLFLENVYTTFDVGNSRVGFARLP